MVREADPHEPSPPGSRGPRSRRWLVAATSFAVAMLVAEVVVRVVVGSPVRERTPLLRVRAHPTRGWEMMPGEAHYTYRHRVHVNELGLRGPDLGPHAEDEVRVLALGDSLVYGQGCADEDTVPSLLEAELRARRPGTRWTVVNGGLRAYGTNQELALLEELGPRVEPDVVLLFWYENDLPYKDVDAVRDRLAASGPVTFDLGVPMEGWARVRWYLEQALRQSALVMWSYDTLVKGEGERMAEVDQDVGFARLDKALARLERQAAELGAVPYFCLIPVAAATRTEAPARAVDLRALATARERGLDALDLHPALHALYVRTGRLAVIPYDGHYDPDGNAAIAAAVAEWLLERLDAAVGAARGG